MKDFADYTPGARKPDPSTPSDHLAIRPAAPPDLPKIAAIAALREKEPVHEWRSVIERIHAQALRGRALLLVAENAGEVAGFGKVGYFAPPLASPENVSPTGWYLTGVVVSPAHRRRGLGLMLTMARLDWIAERSHEAFYFANAHNRASIDLHHAVGFEELTRDFYHPNVRFEGGSGILFRCKLSVKRPERPAKRIERMP
jgi:ribosomal protein S18 acetylase RimI-like enzyme